ncbi:uncharacterized protein LOC6567252 isoform X2 [Drosophila grimshawi]|uniref:uncharacterized protein LOC6567252 isoform X2 n=1 Tax=Drosophila grimshawi TaxID=7222 RepID=UPI000C86E763|nr:uncharacterized protein LOC6567252 isoform X2 [Drosophila grimshawi]
MQARCALKFLLISLVALQEFQLGTGARILAAFFFPGKSHFMMTNSIIRQLVKNGHEVTFITPFSLESENLGSNYKEILLESYDFWTEMKEMSNREIILDMADVTTLTFIRMLHVIGIHSTDFAFGQPAVKALINAKDKLGKYDLLLAEQFYNDGALILGHLYQFSNLHQSNDIRGATFQFFHLWHRKFNAQLSILSRTRCCAAQTLLQCAGCGAHSQAAASKHLSHIDEQLHATGVTQTYIRQYDICGRTAYFAAQATATTAANVSRWGHTWRHLLQSRFTSSQC